MPEIVAILQKVSLAYEEGLFCTVARTRLPAVVVGDRGPDLLAAAATRRGSQQSVLSKKLDPPVKLRCTSQLPVIERGLLTAALMFGSDKSRGYCLEMIYADFLAGADPETL